jgi:hypothetical protein
MSRGFQVHQAPVGSRQRLTNASISGLLGVCGKPAATAVRQRAMLRASLPGRVIDAAAQPTRRVHDAVLEDRVDFRVRTLTAPARLVVDFRNH